MTHVSRKKIIFFGTPDLAVPSLRALAQDDAVKIVGVAVFADKKVGRQQILTPCPVKKEALRLRLPVFEILKKGDIENLCEKLQPDFGIVISFGMIFTEKALRLPSYGMMNVHFSLLPLYRGASPVQSAILHGDQISGITFQQMALELDAGDILLQWACDVQGKKTSELFHFFGEKAAELLPDFLNKFFDHKIVSQEQKNSDATFCTKFERNDGVIQFEDFTAEEIYQRFLAFDVFPGISFASEKYGLIKILDLSIGKKEYSYCVRCKNDSWISIHQAQIPGKKALSSRELLHGYPHLFL